MVIIHISQSDQRQFLYECPATQSLEIIIRDIVNIHNLQTRIQNLCVHGEQLSLYGPAMPEDADESDTEEPSYSSKIRGPYYNKDPSRRRTGEACDPTAAETIEENTDRSRCICFKEPGSLQNPTCIECLKGPSPKYERSNYDLLSYGGCQVMTQYNNFWLTTSK
ncbi:hypothetical protein KI387_006562, partial [Taxus chinensis]